MKQKFLYMFLLILLAAASCTPAGESVTPTAAATSTALPTPSLKITEAPSAQNSAETFLGYWQAEDYENMYAALAQVSRDAITFDDFVARYKETAASLTLQELNFQTLSTLTNPTSAQVAYRVLFDTTMFTQLQTRYDYEPCPGKQRLAYPLGGCPDPSGIKRWQPPGRGYQIPFPRQHQGPLR